MKYLPKNNQKEAYRISIDDYAYDGYNYTFTDELLGIQIVLQLTERRGYMVSLYNLEGDLLEPRICTDTPPEPHPLLFKHFALNAATHIANQLYKDYYVSHYEEFQTNQNLHSSE